MDAFLTANFLLLTSLFFRSVTSQVPPRKEKFFARKVEVPFIICQSCQKGVRHLSREVKQLKSNKGKVDEDYILSIVEKVCNPNTKHGNWIEKLDIVEQDGGLKLIEHSDPAKCKEECKTIAKACEESIAEVDTDLGELLWREKHSTSQLINEVCSKMTNACKKPGKYTLKRKDEEFKPMSKDEQSANDVVKQMSGMPGMPGMEMFSREDLAKMQDTMGGKEKEAEEKETVPPEAPRKTSNPGLLETMQAVAHDVVGWFKKLIGYGSAKTEL